MKRGFTILELLVASLLLGMLVTILTMIFNQSSIAWRTGKASIDDLSDMRGTIAAVREEADNTFVYNSKFYRIEGLWRDDGTLRSRACDVVTESGEDTETRSQVRGKFFSPSASAKPSDFRTVSVGSGQSSKSLKGYTVNVMSAGPDRKFDTWDDIWSWPDAFE